MTILSRRQTNHAIGYIAGLLIGKIGGIVYMAGGHPSHKQTFEILVILVILIFLYLIRRRVNYVEPVKGNPTLPVLNVLYGDDTYTLTVDQVNLVCYSASKMQVGSSIKMKVGVEERFCYMELLSKEVKITKAVNVVVYTIKITAC